MSTKTVILNISGMSCGSCVAKIEKALGGIEGADKVAVDLVNKKAKVKFSTDNIPSDEELISTIEKAGFKASIAA